MKYLLLTLATLFVFSCQMTPPMSDAQKRAMQMKTWENTSYDNVFRAVKTVMQDEGYIIKNQDMNGGLITAAVQKSEGGGAAFFAAMGGNQNYKTGTEYEFSCNMEAVTKTTVETRLALQKKDSYNMGGSSGEVILDPAMYQSFYKKLAVEIERRKAQGKK